MYNSRTKINALAPLRYPKTSRVPHHPLVVAENKKHTELIVHVLQYMISIFAPFRSRSCGRSFRWPLILHCTIIPIIHFSTSQLREILISISQASFIPFSPSSFPTHFQWSLFYFCDGLAPLIAWRQSGKDLHLIGALFRLRQPGNNAP